MRHTVVLSGLNLFSSTSDRERIQLRRGLDEVWDDGGKVASHMRCFLVE
jgi:hypothetical protein